MIGAELLVIAPKSSRINLKNHTGSAEAVMNENNHTEHTEEKTKEKNGTKGRCERKVYSSSWNLGAFGRFDSGLKAVGTIVQRVTIQEKVTSGRKEENQEKELV